MQMYTDRQVALQAAVEFAKESGNINNSFDVVAVAERFRKFLEEGTVETKAKPMATTTGYDVDREVCETEREMGARVATDARARSGWRPRVGNG